ncbi:penicillin acylase family protein [uncultured Nocardioides sp.]|uniref:penicillin acylase family protein n=1 Tax=uncultured Nocardioides sp. TaxID=198441 RepID=UPI00262E8B87|nr:penicillin acylase family protein [uncultured Nocardioides sp.]
MSTPTRPPPPLVAWWLTFRAWPAWARRASWTVVGLVLLLLVLTVTAVVVVRRPLPTVDGELDLPGLSAPVEVLRDEHGVPQLYGSSVDDLLMAQGYVHAQDRFYEMDVRRHLTAGRLSELFGEATLESDALIRTMGWRRVAERELALVSPQTRAALTAYAEGVNAYLEANDPSEIAVQYTVLGLTGLDYRPEPWTPVDSLAWLKAMAWDLRGNVDEEVARVLVGAEHSPRETRQLFPGYPYDRNRPIIEDGGLVDGVFEPEATGESTRLPRPAWGSSQRDLLAGVDEALRSIPSPLGRGDDLGSNSWVVSGERSSTGSPLLANDPHLGVGLPGVWTQVGLHCTEVGEDCPLDVAGFGFSGVPGVVIGHNADIAWGFTNLGPDVADLYLEQVTDETWRYDDGQRPLQVRRETLEVRGGEDVELTVRATDNGPILSDVSEDLALVGEEADPAVAGGGAAADATDDGGSSYAVSLAWTALDPAPTADALLALNTASDWEEFRAAAADFAVPAQNLVYADRAGSTGYQAPGRIPIRGSGNDGSAPTPGWRPENAWTGEYVPFESLPNELDPEEGFVVTANQAVTGPDYPVYLTDDWDRGYRAQRIRERLQAELAEGDVSPEELAAIQLDEQNPLAPTLVPYLLDLDLGDGYAAGGQELLGDWDFTQPASGEQSAAAAYFAVTWSRLLELTFHDELDGVARPDGGDRWMAAVEGLLRRPSASWWDDVDTERVETRDDVLRAAMVRARDDLTALSSPVPEEWEWGQVHSLDLVEPTLGASGIGPVEALVNRGGWDVGGGSEVVNAFGWDAREGYGALTGPSMRMVVDTGDWDASRWVNLTGVSGHPASDHYTDQTDVLVEGDTLPWAFGEDAVRDAAEDALTLLPAEDDEG